MSQPSIEDFVAPFDPTAFNQISGAQLLELVNGATPFGDKGLIMTTTDIAGIPQVPNAFSITKWQTNFWLRIGATIVTVYVWNNNGATDATYLNWISLSSASLGPGSVQGAQIANNTITSANIQSISSNLITGSVVAAWLASLNPGQTAYITNGIIQANSPLFGALGGTLANPTIANNIISLANLMAQSVTGSATVGIGTIVDNTITKLQLLSSDQAGISNGNILRNGAVDPQNNIIVNTQSVVGVPAGGSSVQTSVPGDVLALAFGRTGFVCVNRAVLNLADPASILTPQIPFVAPNTTVYEMVNPQGSNSGSPLGRVLQDVIVQDNTAQTTTNTTGTATAPTTTNHTAITNLFSAFTPLNAGSTLVIEALVNITNSTANNSVFAGLFITAGSGSGVNGIAEASCCVAAAAKMQQVVIKFTVASASLLARTYALYFSGSANTTNYNSTDGSTKMFGGTLGVNSWLRITEYI